MSNLADIHHLTTRLQRVTTYLQITSKYLQLPNLGTAIEVPSVRDALRRAVLLEATLTVVQALDRLITILRDRLYRVVPAGTGEGIPRPKNSWGQPRSSVESIASVAGVTS